MTLTGLAEGKRPDGQTTSIRNALTALKTLRARSGDIETGYEPDDYLDQQTRQLRETCLCPTELWDALADHSTSADDLYRLGYKARARGLYRHAALLWKRAITISGSVEAAADLAELLDAVNPDDHHHAHHWLIDNVIPDEPLSFARLLEMLGCDVGDERFLALAARAAEEIPVDGAYLISELLHVLHRVEADSAGLTLAVRAA